MGGDYISREAVLSFPFANGQYDREHADEHFIHGCESYREWIEQLPAADVVEIRHASWIEDGYYNEPCVCSYCGEPCKDTVMGKPRWNYCPNCGAKMVSAL